MSHDLDVDERVLALRRAFDQSFARGLDDHSEEQRDFLSFCFERQLFALPISELSAVEKRRKLVRLPAAPQACRGLAGVRGKLVAVYDLAALLGFLPSAELRWLVVPRGTQGVAFGVTSVERYLRAPARAVLPRALTAGDACVATLVHDSSTLSVLGTDRLVSALTPRAEEPR